MEIQVRIALKTAQMFEQLKLCYQKELDLTLTKGEILSKAILNTSDLWDEADWSNLDVNITELDVTKGALRPKLQVSYDIEEKLNELRNILTNYFDLNKPMTIGAVIKYALELELHRIQYSQKVTVTKVLNEVLTQFLDKEDSENNKLLNRFTNKILLELENNDLL